jgi:hypothetical protein
MKTFIANLRMNDKLFLLISFMFIFLTGTFCQSKTTEELIHERKDSFYLCEAPRNGIAAANLLSGDSSFSIAKTSIQKAGADKHEHSITFGRDSNHNISISPIINGDVSNGSVCSDWPGAFADIHNHTNDQPPSAGDLYYLVRLNNKNQLYNSRFVVTKEGAVYVLFVYDLKLANDFLTKHPVDQTPGFSPRFPEPMFEDVDKASAYFEGKGIDRLTAQERALALVLAKYKSGVILLKQVSIGNFLSVQTEEKDSGGRIVYVVHNCN